MEFGADRNQMHLHFGQNSVKNRMGLSGYGQGVIEQQQGAADQHNTATCTCRDAADLLLFTSISLSKRLCQVTLLTDMHFC